MSTVQFCAILALCVAPLSFAQLVHLRSAPLIDVPNQVDGNSPSFWFDGQFRFITSTGAPVILRGADQFALGERREIAVDGSARLPMWIESVWVDDEDGAVYGWYHHEPRGLCRGSDLTAPQIGAAVSYDGGETFHDLGLVLTSGDPIDCGAQNGFFAGGNGDFSVILDRDRRYFYFLFTHYGGHLASQGIATARLAFEDRKSPSGAVWKYFAGDWTEPGLEGRVTPVFAARTAWQSANADSLWGPAIHWNSYLESYVVLMNHACCKPRWPQEGIYISSIHDLSEPWMWSPAKRILSDIEWAPGYYPMVIGLGPGETDTLAGEVGRLYVQGRSIWELYFRREGDVEVNPGADDTAPDDAPDSETVPAPANGRVRRGGVRR